jgi:predicted aspartyl protease
MIAGSVNSNLEAMIRLHVEDAHGQTQAIDFKVDTAFTAFVNLPAAMIASLGLRLIRYEYVLIGDGSTAHVPVHAGVVIWDGKPRPVDFHAMGREPLIGMAMMASHDLAVRIRDGGAVSITLTP